MRELWLAELILDDGFPVAGYFSAHSGTMQPLHFLDHGKPLEIHPHCNIMVNESNAHLAVALAGIGLVHTLDFMVRPAVERGDLVVLLDAWRPKPLEVYISYAPSRQLSTKVRVFADWVTQLYGRIQNPSTPATEGIG